MEFGYLPLILFQVGGKNVNILKFYFPLILLQAGIGKRKENTVHVYIPLALFQVKIRIWSVCKLSFLTGKQWHPNSYTNRVSPDPGSTAQEFRVQDLPVKLGPTEGNSRSGTHRRSSGGCMHRELWPLRVVQCYPNLLEVQDTPDHSS